jgi:hypothetical protein
MSETISSEPDAEREFRLSEYEALREETLERLKELWQLEKFALGGSAAIASWILTNTEKNIPVLAWWLPFILVLLCALRFGAGMYHLAFRTSKYLQEIEAHFLGQNGGWEKWFRNQPPNETIAYASLWIVGLGATVAFPLFRCP